MAIVAYDDARSARGASDLMKVLLALKAAGELLAPEKIDEQLAELRAGAKRAAERLGHSGRAADRRGVPRSLARAQAAADAVACPVQWCLVSGCV